MSEKKIKNIFLSISIFILIVFLLSLEKVLYGLKLLWFKIISIDLRLISFNEFDFIIGLLILFVFVFISASFLIFYFNLFRWKFYEKLIDRLRNFNSEFLSGIVLLYLLIFLSVTASVISPDDPSFYKDIRLTKLLPPFTTMHYVRLKTSENFSNEKEKIEKILFENFIDERRIYFQQLEIENSKIKLIKEKSIEELPIENVETKDGLPEIYTKLFFLGTDEFGRDLLSRIIFGIRISLLIGVFSVFVSFLLGSVIGYSAGVIGGFVDNFLMRVVDFFLSFPVLFFVIFLIAFVGNSILLLVFVFGFSGWMYVARLARNESIACMKKEFVQTLILAGQTKFMIVFKHILPNTFAPILITLIFQFSNVVIAESALSFLGLGVQPPTPTLGGIIKTGYDYFSLATWISFSSALALIIIVLTFNLIGEGLKKSEAK